MRIRIKIRLEIKIRLRLELEIDFRLELEIRLEIRLENIGKCDECKCVSGKYVSGRTSGRTSDVYIYI